MSTDDGVPDSAETSGYYDITNQILIEVWDENFHHGYWDSDEDQSSNREACDKLTDQVIDRSGDVSGLRLLDVGCGFGLPAFRLAGQVPTVTIVGISNNQQQVDAVNRRSTELGLSDRVTFENVDAQSMPYEDSSFDVVWVFETLPHLDRLIALTEIARVLKPGGKVVFTDMFLNAEPGDEELAEVRKHEAENAFPPMPLEHEYRDVVKRSGLVLDEFKDISANTHRTGVRVKEAVESRWDELVEKYGEGIIPILDAFKNPAGDSPIIGYMIAVAHKAD